MGAFPVGPPDADSRVKSIFCFAVAPAFQRKGIAGQLLTRVCEEAAREGERKRMEREREGISEGAQAEYEERYERVSGDVGRMRGVFRKFYQRQVEYWQRWMTRGRMDDGALPLIVAGEERVFKRRQEPRKYKVRISMLVDQSGSMAGDKISAVADTVLMMLEAIKGDQGKGIKVEVAGFYDEVPGETQDDVKGHYFEYGEKITKQRMVEVIKSVGESHGGNNDLRGLFWAMKRIPKGEADTLNL
jgi:cobalamin biosynthesis protein CobT